MKKTSQSEKVLRVGVIHNGRILEERLILARADVSVGRGRDATISLPFEELPERVTLFPVHRGRYHLAAVAGARAQIRSGGGVIETGPDGGARPRLHPLGDDAQGRVELGGVLFLFQFVHPPPAMPAIKLPELARVTWAGRIDRPYAAILALIFLAHVGVVMAVQSAPLPITPECAVVQDEHGRIIEVVIPKPKDEPREAVGDASEAAPEEQKPTSRPHAQAAKAAPAAGRTAGETRAYVADKGVLGILRAKDSSGAIRQLFDEGPRVAGLDELVEGNRVASAGGDVSARRFVEPAGGRTAAPGAIDVGGNGPRTGPAPGAQIEKTDRTDVASLGGITKIELPQVEGCLEKDKVAAVMKAKLRGLQDCYERELKKYPSLAGRLTIAFTIDALGAVADARVEKDEMGSAPVADCLVTRVRRFRFPKSDCESVTVSYPFVFVKAQ